MTYKSFISRNYGITNMDYVVLLKLGYFIVTLLDKFLYSLAYILIDIDTLMNISFIDIVETCR